MDGRAGLNPNKTREREKVFCLGLSELRVPGEVLAALGDDTERGALEALLVHLIRTTKVSVVWVGRRLGLDRQEVIYWYTSYVVVPLSRLY